MTLVPAVVTPALDGLVGSKSTHVLAAGRDGRVVIARSAEHSVAPAFNGLVHPEAAAVDASRRDGEEQSAGAVGLTVCVAAPALDLPFNADTA